MKQHYLALLCLLPIFMLMAGCKTAPGSARPITPKGIPDLTKGEGPAADKARGIYHLFASTCRGWIYRDKYGRNDDARQILITEVPAYSVLRHELKVGDVILGVNGKYFSENPIREFRRAQAPALKTNGSFDVILWRKGWEKDRIVTLNWIRHLPMDFTSGDKEGKEVDWNLGPTGARGYMEGLNLHSYVTRQILITSVEKGSPADGILERGDVIMGIGGKAFTSDARYRLGEAIAKAETKAGGGNLKLLVWRSGSTKSVTIKLRILGNYSDTTPWNCEKSEAILKQACRYLIRNKIIEKGKIMDGQRQLAALALLSTGDKAHFAIAKKQVYRLAKAVDDSGDHPPVWFYECWGWSYANLLLSEYYLLTKDTAVLPAIHKLSAALIRLQSTVGTWGHGLRHPVEGRLLGYGAMNQVGNICLLSLVLARKCGAGTKGINGAIKRGASFLRQFVGLSEVPYGDNLTLDWPNHDNNGKCSSAAVVFALLKDEQSTSYYSKMTVASHDVREFGHTGNWWSFLWGPLGAVRASQRGCTAFLKELAPLHDLERRWDGGFTYQGKLNIAMKSGREHKNKGWDTTGCRILMYTLPRKLLYITGKDGFSAAIADAEVPKLIEDGARPPKDVQRHNEKYDDLDTVAILKRLERWSPIVRNCAASSLAKKDNPPVAELVRMLGSKNRYARYGACTALRHIGPRAAPAVDHLIAALKENDPLMQINAAMALGAIGDKKAATPLLELARRDLPNDPRRLVQRFSARALFGRTGLLKKSIEDVDRKQLTAAIQALLSSPGGYERSIAAEPLKTFTSEELQPLWPDLLKALATCAPTDIMFASGVRLTVVDLLAKQRAEEGLPVLWHYFKNQKMHGSEKRNKAIMDAIVSYGAKARVLLPQMEDYLKLIQSPPRCVDQFAPNPNPTFYPGQVLYVKEGIKAIKATKITP